MAGCKHHLLRGLVVILALLLAACSSETTITLYENEKWSVENVSDVNTALMPEFSVGDEIFPGLGIDMGVDTGAWTSLLMGKGLDELTPYYQEQNIIFSWSERNRGEDITIYTLRWEGQGWDKLCNVILTGTETSLVAIGNNQVRFAMRTPSDELGLNTLVDMTVHLRANEIVQSNAHEIQGGRATWYNPVEQMTATVALSEKFHIGIPLLIIGGGIVGIGVIASITWVLRPSLKMRYPRVRTTTTYRARTPRHSAKRPQRYG